MAISHVYIYTIVILVCKSNTENIYYGDLCLESAANFMNVDGTSRCEYKERDVRTFLKNASITCPKRCKFTMSNSNSNGKRGLKFQLFFNTKNETVDACGANKNGKFRNIYINCSSWNDDDHAVWGSGNCQDSKGQCDRISTVCVCHCQPGYTMVENNCKNANIKLNEPCESDTQCTGTDTSRNCTGGICVCQVGHVSINNTCHQGNIALGHNCVSDVQCTGTPWATNCSAGQCTCQVGHVPVNNTCHPGNIALGHSCVSDVQCTGTPWATNCSAGQCTCQVGHVPVNNTCHPVTERQGHRADGNKKSPFAAIIGGLFAGVVIVTVSAFLIYRRFCRNDTTRKEPVIRFKNHQYDTNGVDDNTTPLRETKQENAANKSPHDHSEEAVDYSHIYDETRDVLTQDDVYHHLNEEEQKKDDNNYDHASAAVGHVTNLSEYSLISDFKNDRTVSLTEEQDEYFVIEQSFSKDG
ncbi:uncharacterized protein LOC128161232 [Crassostrea angulata]|uniref:uncharacterized protein LOC128161232 n=1 Tax=Magallana angulata TaxID=2784310 RepID=UPI0022B1FEF4|nr:uncharacterized protein LOC128161232 [Crassostrea angulata]